MITNDEISKNDHENNRNVNVINFNWQRPKPQTNSIEINKADAPRTSSNSITRKAGNDMLNYFTFFNWNSLWTNNKMKVKSNGNLSNALPMIKPGGFTSIRNIIKINKVPRNRSMIKEMNPKHEQYLIDKKSLFNYRDVTFPSKQFSTPSSYRNAGSAVGRDTPMDSNSSVDNKTYMKNEDFIQRVNRSRRENAHGPISLKGNTIVTFPTNYTANTMVHSRLGTGKRITKYKNCGAVTNQGRTFGGAWKCNQDSHLIWTDLPYPLKLFGVFDGHGELGLEVSEFLRGYFIDFFMNSKSSEYFIGNHFTAESLTSYFTARDNEVIRNLFRNIDKEVYSNQHKTGHNYSFSGSTCNIVLWLDNIILSWNVGDSRAIMVTSMNTIIQLSRDHKPEWEDEKRRIIQMNGRVEKASSWDPYRVWSKTGGSPGLAMSRSIGDFMAKSVGVISEPETRVWNNEEYNCKCIVVASDGVWDYLSNENVRNIVMEYYEGRNCDDAANAVKDKAKEMWEKHGDVSDDITVIVVFYD